MIAKGNGPPLGPGYCETVAEHGLVGVLGLPMIIDDERIGSLDVYDATDRFIDPVQPARPTLRA